METKNIHLNSNGDMVKEKVVYSVNGPDDMDAEVLLSDSEKFESTSELKDEDNIPF